MIPLRNQRHDVVVETIVILTTINERKRIRDDMWLCPRCGTANPKYIEKMETRKLSGKHHRTDILHIFQRIGIIVIVVATKYNPNCTPSNIKKIWTWQSQTDEFSTIFGCSDEGPTQPGPLQRSFESYCGRWSDSMSFDEVWKEVGLSEKWTIHEYPRSNSPLAILLAPFSDPGVLQASNFIQGSEFPNNFRLRTSRNPPRGFRLILCHEGCLFRKNPSIQRMRLIFNGRYDRVEYEKYYVLS